MKKYPLFDIYSDQEDIEAVSKIIKRGNYWACGPENSLFEKKLSEFYAKKYCTIFNSGTSALHSVLLAYGVTSGKVIVPAFTFISTVNTVLLTGAKPIFAEIEGDTLGLDYEDVIRKYSKDTKAIIIVHYGGNFSRDTYKIKKFAQKHSIILIEDTAESFGAKNDNNLAGTIGNAGLLSFCQNKILTTGEGGAIITDDAEIYKKLELIRSHGRVETKNEDYFSKIDVSDYIQIGYNFRLSTINAALGLSQLKKIEKIIKLRRKVGKRYDELFQNNKNFDIIEELPKTKAVYQLYTIILKDGNKRRDLQNYLQKNGIASKIYFDPIHLKTFYREKFNFKSGDLPITESISRRVLTLPMSLKFERKDQIFIAEKLKEFFLFHENE